MSERFVFLIVLVFLCLSVSISSLAQSSSISYQSVVVNEKLEGIGGAYVKNISSNQFAVTDTSGIFLIKCQRNDSLIISAMGYELRKILVNDQGNKFIQLMPIIFTLDQVDIYDFKNWEGFKEEFLATEVPGDKVNISGLPHGIPSQKPTHLRTNTFDEKPTIFHFAIHPFSSLAYFLNNDEKSKREVWKLMKLENREMAYWMTMNADTIQSWVDIPDSHIQEFILFCNRKIDEKGLDSTYYYKEKIIDLYPLFLAKMKEEQ